MVLELDDDVLEQAKHRALEYFDNETSIYSLQLHPSSLQTFGLRPSTILNGEACFLYGIHFVFTDELLRIEPDYKPQVIMELSDKHIYLRSIELQELCKYLTMQVSIDVLECIDVPFLHRNDGFIRFEELAGEFLTKRLLKYETEISSEHNSYDYITPASTLNFLYDIIRIERIAKLGYFVHELDAVLEDTCFNRKIWKLLVVARSEQRELTRLEKTKIREEVEDTLPQIRKLIDISDLPDEPSPEAIKALDDELLKFRKSFI